MLLEIALATAIHKTNPRLLPQTAQRWAHILVQESETRGLDPWVFFAIVHQESRWVPNVIHQYPKHRYCDVGLSQIHVRCHNRWVQPLLNPELNLHRSAQIQQEAMKYCLQSVCEKGWVFLYNHSGEYVLAVNQEAEEARHGYTREVRSAATP